MIPLEPPMGAIARSIPIVQQELVYMPSAEPSHIKIYLESQNETREYIEQPETLQWGTNLITCQGPKQCHLGQQIMDLRDISREGANSLKPV